ncbi:transglutaminase-like putative cysteine protease [Thermocatellispora tengchongensis]|uniref:Transglutaminase-like putative cysteine protease n=1 Tax=Thermocatellispora tengchongensis TaxID=1073253 RepID=A0A840PA54_9ACTN|nr:transglutaminase family protein [Thermocatellispora tengchongensis]MBB5135536.1 transglutaminase-like putative cysteine protease [Thermocatellispora tengchongensis]
MLSFAAGPWDYLAEDEAIDHKHPIVQRVAAELRTGDDVAYARAAFEYVRDRVTHSLDVRDHRVTWRASDVLSEGTGLCYAKAHAFVALLRAGGIRSGLCYQRIRSNDRFFVHGLAAALVDDRWVRLDPRGNRPGIDVRFSATEDSLAYRPDPSVGEADYFTVYATPHPVVLEVLTAHDDSVAMCENGHLPSALDD